MEMNYYLRYNICECCGKEAELLHIGKFFSAYKFAFRIHNDKNIKKVEDWIKLIENENNIIVDELGENISSAQFIDLIDSKMNEESQVEDYIPFCSINQVSTDGRYDYFDFEFN